MEKVGLKKGIYPVKKEYFVSDSEDLYKKLQQQYFNGLPKNTYFVLDSWDLCKQELHYANLLPKYTHFESNFADLYKNVRQHYVNGLPKYTYFVPKFLDICKEQHQQFVNGLPNSIMSKRFVNMAHNTFLDASKLISSNNSKFIS